MKNKLMIIISCTLLLLAAGCKKDKLSDEPETLFGSVEKPSWKVPDEYDYSSSMTAVVKVEKLNGQIINDEIINAADMLAAFAGDVCVGVASPTDGLFFLYISKPEQEQDGDITLRYWSAHYNRLFEAKDAFVFQHDMNLGTIAAPFIPQMTAVE